MKLQITVACTYMSMYMCLAAFGVFGVQSICSVQVYGLMCLCVYPTPCDDQSK